MALTPTPMSISMEMIGWLKAPLRTWKKIRGKMLEDDLEGILGGWTTTLGRVSRMEVREGTIWAPDSVMSQYCRF
jgi:hypothetical protein